MKHALGADKVPPVGLSRRRRRRPNKAIAAAIGVVILAGAVGGSAIAYSEVKGRADKLQAAITTNLQAGQKELEAGKVSLTQANSKRETNLIVQAIAHFSAAKAQFVAARQLADNSRLLHALEQVPAAGYFAQSRQTTVDAVADMGIALSDAGQGLSNLDGQLIRPPGSGQAARNLLTAIDQMQAGLLEVRLDLDRAQRAAEEVDVSLLPASQQATFEKARNAIATGESGLDEFGRLVPVLKEVLGGNGARTYLIEQVNPAELRAGGGFIGTYSLVGADHGTLAVKASGDAYDLANPRPDPGQAGFVPQPSPLREIIPNIPWSFVDSNVFPDFQSNAKAALSFVQPRLATKIDGVIAMDYYAVAKMLELTGPLAVPGYDLTVDSSNFIAQVIRIDVTLEVHKTILSSIAGPLMARVSGLPPDKWPALVAAFNSLAAEHHLQVYFTNESAQNEIGRIGWSGGLNPTGMRDFLMEVESNYAGDKVNYFITRHYTVELTRKDGTLHHKVTVDLVNATPSDNYVRTYYDVNIRLYVGAEAVSISNNLRPVKYSNPAAPSGSQLVDGWLPRIRCCGAADHARFEYDTPWAATEGINEVYWQKQPGVVNDSVDVVWNDGDGHTFRVHGDLTQDRVIKLSPTGVTLTAGHPAQAALPSLNLG